MSKCWLIALPLAALLGCGGNGSSARMEKPEDPQGRYHDQIAAAQHLLDQRETWSDRAEWEVVPSGTGWTATAWRIEHPDRQGPSRYVPWGYSVIELDSRMVAIHYYKKG